MSLEQYKNFAIEEHRKVNQKYGEYDYSLHLSIVAAQAERWIHILACDSFMLKEKIIGAAWCHDVLEDTHNSYNDLIRKTNVLVADIVYAVTNEKGKTRDQRANKNYYRGIREQEFAPFVKLCDRIGNGLFSKATNSRQFEMYKKENEKFIEYVIPDNDKEMYQPMVDELRKIFE